jgi:hypothetical protein
LEPQAKALVSGVFEPRLSRFGLRLGLGVFEPMDIINCCYESIAFNEHMFEVKFFWI